MQIIKDLTVKRNALLAIFVLLFSFMGGYSFFYGTVGSLQWYSFYFGRLFLVLFYAVYSYTLHIKRIDTANAKWMMKLLLTPLTAMLIYSVGIWTINNTATPYMTRGISSYLFIAGAYIAGISIAKVLKVNVFKYGLYAAIITMALSIIIGLVTLKGQFIPLALRGENPYLELSELIFTIGLYLICMMFTKGCFNKKANKILLIIGIICFILGGKRIGLAGVLLTSIFGMLFTRKSPRIKKIIVRLAGTAIAIFVFLYTYISATGALDVILHRYGIEMSGRNIIYNYFRKFCEFKISYLGQGIGFVQRQFDYTTSDDLYNMVSIKALHNDFFKYYIDLGFIGFIAWLWYWIKAIPAKLEKRIGINGTLVCFCLLMYSFITYATDNTAEYFNYQMHLAMLITAVSSGYLNIKVGASDDKHEG